MKIYKNLSLALQTPEIVQALDIDDVEVRILPEAISKFKNLKKLRAAWIKKIPNSVGELEHLKFLSLPFCQTNLPKVIGELAHLEELHWTAFRDNARPPPRELFKLKNLKVLNFFCSKFDRIPDEIFDLRSLEVLSVQDCRRITELPAALGNLQGLKILQAHCSRLTKIPFEITKLANLEVFDFSKTPLSEKCRTQGKKSVKTFRRMLLRKNLSAAEQRRLFKEIFGQ